MTLNIILESRRGYECNLMVERMPSVHKALGAIPSTKKEIKLHRKQKMSKITHLSFNINTKRAK